MKQVRQEELAQEEVKRQRERIVNALFESKKQDVRRALKEIRDVAEDCEYA